MHPCVRVRNGPWLPRRSAPCPRPGLPEAASTTLRSLEELYTLYQEKNSQKKGSGIHERSQTVVGRRVWKLAWPPETASRSAWHFAARVLSRGWGLGAFSSWLRCFVLLRRLSWAANAWLLDSEGPGTSPRRRDREDRHPPSCEESKLSEPQRRQPRAWECPPEQAHPSPKPARCLSCLSAEHQKLKAHPSSDLTGVRGVKSKGIPQTFASHTLGRPTEWPHTK